MLQLEGKIIPISRWRRKRIANLKMKAVDNACLERPKIKWHRRFYKLGHEYHLAILSEWAIRIRTLLLALF